MLRCAGFRRFLAVFSLTTLVASCTGSSNSSGFAGNGVPLTTCSNDGQCARPTPYCDNNVCVQCIANPNCGVGTTCDVASHTCVQCSTDAECSARGGSPYCDTASHRCVACTTDTNCQGMNGGMGTMRVCDTQTHSCQNGCQTNANCMGGRPYCATARRLCVECMSNANCSGNRPYCLDTGACVACMTDANCNGGVCNLTTHTCGLAVPACVTNMQCPQGQQCTQGQCR